MFVIISWAGKIATFATAIDVHTDISEETDHCKQNDLFISYFSSLFTKFSLPLLLSQLETNQAAREVVFFSLSLVARCLLALPNDFIRKSILAFLGNFLI